MLARDSPQFWAAWDCSEAGFTSTASLKMKWFRKFCEVKVYGFCSYLASFSNLLLALDDDILHEQG